jgi:hypothetical protein
MALKRARALSCAALVLTRKEIVALCAVGYVSSHSISSFIWIGIHVAFMSHGVAGSDWESLKHKGNYCNIAQHEKALARKLRL